MKAHDFIGRLFGSVSVLSETEPYFSPKGDRDRQFRCSCVCGKEWTVRSSSLRRGITSCGCVAKPCVKHGSARKGAATGTYRIWAGMIQRCHNPRNPKYKNYGARGIEVCAEWRRDFSAFLRDMGERPPGLTIERVNNDRPYAPNNCRWATMLDQGRNKRNNVTLVGETLSEAAVKLGLTHAAISQRLRRGWPLERAFTAPRWHKSKNS